MEYFKYNSSFLNTLNFTTSSYSDLDDYLNGVVKNYLNHNYSFLPLAPTLEELDELKTEIGASYDLMLGDVKPRYVEMLRLSTQQEFETIDEVVSEYGNETQTGSYYEPKVNSAQAQINTNGNLTSWDDDTTTTTRTEHRVLSESAIKDFFKEIKEEVELYFINYVNLFADGDNCERQSFTKEQLEAINSGINANKVNQIEENKNNIELKQDKLNVSQMQAVNSGITYSLVTQIGTNEDQITIINSKIPSQASDTNQLADKNFVNSSIATNTANFIGTFNSVAELEAYSGTLTNNDYAFVISTDGDGNTIYNRYKYNGAEWLFEYSLNNSSFTASQWAAINSGITTSLVTKLNDIDLSNYSLRGIAWL